MEIDKIRRLFSPYDSRQQKSDKIKQEQQSTGAKQPRPDAGGAVKIASDFGSSKPVESEDSAHQAKLRRIKEQVDTGSYRPDSRDVAKAIIEELVVV